MFGINRSTKVVALVAVMAMVATALIAPAAIGAKKASVPFKVVASLHMTGGGGSAGKGTLTIGKNKPIAVTAKGTIAPPKMSTTFKAAGGSVTTMVKNGKIKNGALVGTYTLKGTGKYKNISGSGKLNAPVATLVFTFKGTASL